MGNLFASVGPEQLSRLTKIIIFVTYTTIFACYLFGSSDM